MPGGFASFGPALVAAAICLLVALVLADRFDIPLRGGGLEKTTNDGNWLAALLMLVLIAAAGVVLFVFAGTR